MKNMSAKQEVWIGWLGAISVSAIAGTYIIITFAYAQFETKEHANERISSIDKRLERIEMKLDALNETKRGKGN